MFDGYKLKRHERTIFFVAVLMTSFAGVVYLLRDYITLIALSLIFSVVVHPLYSKLNTKLRVPSSIAALLTIVTAFILIIFPLYFIIHLLAVEVAKITSSLAFEEYSLNHTLETQALKLNLLLDSIPLIRIQVTPTDLEALVANGTKMASEYFLKWVIGFGTASVRYIADLFVFLLLTFFMIPSLPRLREYILAVSPLHDEIDEMYIDRCVALTISLIKSIFIVALSQGILGGIFMWMAGVPCVLTVTMILVFASLIPFVGTNLVALPIALFMLLQGNVASALIIVIGQTVFVSNIDNILEAAILSRGTSLNPAVMLLSIVGGLSVFGITGILFGPLVCILFLTSLEIYLKHYRY